MIDTIDHANILFNYFTYKAVIYGATNKSRQIDMTRARSGIGLPSLLFFIKIRFLLLEFT